MPSVPVKRHLRWKTEIGTAVPNRDVRPHRPLRHARPPDELGVRHPLSIGRPWEAATGSIVRFEGGVGHFTITVVFALGETVKPPLARQIQ